MGFLDHSTNNILVDAVLTDLGRQALSRNDGSFNISLFALGDDEIDYNVIQQFGRTVGKNKIELNTPIMEALTAGSLALKHKLTSISNEFQTHFPVLDLRLRSGGTNITFTRKGNVTVQNLDVVVSSKTGVPVDEDLLDAEFRVEINHLFLGIVGESPDIVHSDNIAVYRIPTTFGNADEALTAKLPIRLKNFSTTTFNTFSVAGGSYIKTFIKVRGLNSGLTKQIEVQIS